MAASQRPGRLRRMRQRLASSLLPPLWACALWWLLAASTTIAVTWKAGVVLLICLGVLKSSWLATSYLVPEEEVEGFIAWTATAFRFLVTWVAALGLALALLYIGIADARLGWISLAPLGAFFACLSCSLWGPPGRMAIFEFLAPWPIAEGIYQARARNRPLFVFVPALRALRRWSRRWPVAQELGEEWLLAKDCARAAYRDLWYSPAYGPVRRGLALTLMAPLRLRLLLSTRLGPWALGYLCRLAQAPWLQRTWPGRTANTQYRAAHRALGAARRRYAPLADWACLGGRALAYFWNRPPFLLCSAPRYLKPQPVGPHLWTPRPLWDWVALTPPPGGVRAATCWAAVRELLRAVGVSAPPPRRGGAPPPRGGGASSPTPAFCSLALVPLARRAAGPRPAGLGGRPACYMSPGPSVSGRLRPAGLGGRPACYMSPGPGGAGRLRTAGPGRAGRGRPGPAAPAGPSRPPRTGQPGGVSIYGLEYLRFSAKPPQSVLAAWPPMVNVEASLKKFSSLAWFAVWAAGLGWVVVSAPTAREALLALSLTVIFWAGSFLGSQWLARAYCPAEVTDARPIAKYSAAFGRAVAPAVRATLAPALLVIGATTQHLAVVVLGSLAALCACVGVSLFWDAPRMAAFEALAPQLLREGLELARAANRPVLVCAPALAALRAHPTEQRLERAVTTQAAVAKTTYRDLWYSAKYAPLRAGVLRVLWGPAEARLYASDHWLTPARQVGKAAVWVAAGRAAPVGAGAPLFSAEAYLCAENLNPLGRVYVILWPYVWGAIAASGLPRLCTPRVVRVASRLGRLSCRLGRGWLYLWRRRPLLPDLGTKYLRPRPHWAPVPKGGAYARVEAGLRLLGATSTPACLNVFSEAEVFASAGGPLFPPLFLGWSFVSRALLVLVGLSMLGWLAGHDWQN